MTRSDREESRRREDEVMDFLRRKPKSTPDDVSMLGFYEVGPKTRNYSLPPDPEQLTQDLNKAHTNIRKLVRLNDSVHRSNHFLRVWNKVLSAAVLGSWAVILMLLKICILHK